MKTPVKGDKHEVDRRVKELIGRGWRKRHEPIIINAGGYRTRPKYYVEMEYVGDK